MKKTKSTSPKGGRKGCLCKDGTYSSKCCDGEVASQGIGSTQSGGSSSVNNVDGTRTTTRQNG